jgi:(S)-mandelate dehydrogenase
MVTKPRATPDVALTGDNLGAYNIEDLRQKAKARLPRGVFEYVDRGAEDELALNHNRHVYQSLKIKNRVLIDVPQRPTATEIFGHKITMPYGISPTASAGLMSDRGEIALAQAAARMGVPCTAATNSLTPVGEIHEASGGNLWFQLYMWQDPDLRHALVDRIRSIGIETLLVTVDGSVGSNRESDYRNGFPCHCAIHLN